MLGENLEIMAWRTVSELASEMPGEIKVKVLVISCHSGGPSRGIVLVQTDSNWNAQGRDYFLAWLQR